MVARFWEIVAHYRVWMFSGVPTIYAALLEVPVGNRDISSLEFAICGAAPMPVALIKAFEAKTGLKVLEGYGLTEATCVSSVNPPHGDRPGRVDRVQHTLPADAGGHSRRAGASSCERPRSKRWELSLSRGQTSFVAISIFGRTPDCG